MKSHIETILEQLAAKRTDKRLHLFDVRVAEAGDHSAKLTGRVLADCDLQALRDELARMPDRFTVDDTAVRVLRTETSLALQLIATNLTDLHRGPSFLEEMATQVTNGTVLEVLEQREKWSFVRQTDGYLGWAYTGFLAPASTAAAKATHFVTLPAIDVRAEPEMMAHPTTRIPIGSAVHVDATNTSWARVQFAGAMLQSGWVHGGGLRELKQFPLTIAETREQIVADARRLTGCYYLWGGNTAWGLDCSGLAGLCHRLSGYTLPRDADMQFAAGHTVDGDKFEAGDLFFFWNDSRTKIGHVGIATGDGWNMIHSSRSRNGVYEEDVQKSESLKASYAGVRSYIGRE